MEKYDHIKDRLALCLEGVPGNWQVCDMKRGNRGYFDIAVIGEKMDAACRCKVLICPADRAEQLAERVEHSSMVTVGYSSADAVTFSSMAENAMSVCFTCDITPFFGPAIPQGEVVLKNYSEPISDMMVSAVLRCIGVV